MFTFFSVQSNDGKDDERTWEENRYTEQEIIIKKISYYVLLQDIEYSSLRYTVGPCLPILYVIVCI